MKNQRIKIYTIPILLFTASFGFAQSNTVATGGDATGSGGSASFTVGQIDYNNVDATVFNSNEGVQQPYEFYGLTGIEEMNLVTQVYPNPTTGKVQIISDEKGLSYQIHDDTGKIVHKGSINENATIIDFSPFASGTYLLEIGKDSNNIQKIKIIKN